MAQKKYASLSSLQTFLNNLRTIFVDKAGDTMTGALTLSTNPTENLHAATKQYVDDSASTTLDSAKGYTDEVKNSLLNGAGEAYDTLLELGNLINDNTDTIDALEIVAAGKQATITGGATTITSVDLTKDRALISDSAGKVAVSNVTSTELGYLDSVTSNVQTQIDAKMATTTFNTAIANYYTKTEVDALSLIEIEDIDAICGASIQVANANGGVTF